jgi:beta-glucosidase
MKPTFCVRRVVTFFLPAMVLAGSGGAFAASTPPVIKARVKSVITVAGLQFKDANGNGQLDPYEDWRLTPAERTQST